MSPDVTHFSILDAVPESKAYDYEMLLEKLKNELSKFGLTANQSKVYLFLEKYGPSTATQVSKTLKVPRTETYHLLTNLQNKGIVSATFQHPIRFSALSLDKAMGVLINAEKERSEEHTSELQSRLHLVCRLLLEKKKEKQSR